MEVTFAVWGEPKGKGRPRFSRVGGYVKTYTPKDTLSYEGRILNAYKEAAGGTYFTGEVDMHIACFFGIPKSTSRKRSALMLAGDIRPTKKPDADNIAKIVADALNGVAYRDDTQIVELSVSRYYGEPPCVVVTLTGGVEHAEDL